MVCAPVRSIIPSLKLGDYLSVQAHNPCSISHLELAILLHLPFIHFPTNYTLSVLTENPYNKSLERNVAYIPF